MLYLVTLNNTNLSSFGSRGRNSQWTKTRISTALSVLLPFQALQSHKTVSSLAHLTQSFASVLTSLLQALLRPFHTYIHLWNSSVSTKMIQNDIHILRSIVTSQSLLSRELTLRTMDVLEDLFFFPPVSRIM